MDSREKHLIIGAGPAGLAHAKALKMAGIAYDQVEADDDVGGNWYHGVYETAHIISSRKVTEFKDYPMPDHYPDFPSAQNMYDYIKDYAQHFDLEGEIEFNTKVIYVRPVDDNLWEVTLENGELRLYKGVLVCNGHHWSRRYPEYPGKFSGEFIHSKDYKRPAQLEGKRVLVIGGGNSACDVASEAARVSACCHMSLRGGVWFLPKTLMGKPLTDMNLMQNMPIPIQREVIKVLVKTTFGDYEDYGLPKPDYKIFEKHPTVSTEILHYIKHGRIRPRAEIERYDGKTVHFKDGGSDNYDMIIAATGFHLDWPFLPTSLQRAKGVVAQVYAGCLFDDYKGLYIIGTTQPRGGLGSLVTPASEYVARLIRLQDKIGVPLGLVFRKMGQKIPATHLQDPVEIQRRLRLSRLMWPMIESRAKRIDRRYTGFSNRVIEALPGKKMKRLREMVVY
jgi:cation diffusion facilitator CzcD-associated flavoprotein CzcO